FASVSLFAGDFQRTLLVPVYPEHDARDEPAHHSRSHAEELGSLNHALFQRDVLKNDDCPDRWAIPHSNRHCNQVIWSVVEGALGTSPEPLGYFVRSYYKGDAACCLANIGALVQHGIVDHAVDVPLAHVSSVIQCRAKSIRVNRKSLLYIGIIHGDWFANNNRASLDR